MLIHMGKEIENGKFYGKLKKVEKGLLRGRGDHAEGDILAGSGGLLAGVVYGLLKAPMTAGYHKYVGCNNGNNFSGGRECCCERDEEE